MSGLTIIPTETSGSLGPNKKNRFTAPNDTEYITDGEWNTVKGTVAELAAAFGLGDGTTDGSIEQAVRRALNAPSTGRGRWCIVDDFTELNVLGEEHGVGGQFGTWRSEADVDSGGFAELVDCTVPPGGPSGFGWVRLTVDGGLTALIEIRKRRNMALGVMNPVLRARVRFGTNLAEATPRIGFYDTATGPGMSLAEIRVVNGAWQLESRSLSNGSNQTAVPGGGPSADSTYDLRIEVEADTAVRFYAQKLGDDEELLATITAPAAVIGSSDALGWRFRLDATAAGGGDYFFIDFIEVEGVRP